MTKRPVGLMWYLVSSSSRCAGNNGLDHVLQNVGAEFVVADVFGMLGRNDHGIHALYFFLLVVLDGDLGFAVRTQVRAGAILADFGEF